MRITVLSLLLAVAVTGITNAQPGRRGQFMRDNQQAFCMNIPDLTDAQKEKITALNAEHREVVDQLRDERFKAEDVYTRNEISSKMLLEQNKHLKNIEALLSDSQKDFFTQNFVSGSRGNMQPMMNGRGNGRGRGPANMGRGQGRGLQRGPGMGPGRACPRVW